MRGNIQVWIVRSKERLVEWTIQFTAGCAALVVGTLLLAVLSWLLSLVLLGH